MLSPSTIKLVPRGHFGNSRIWLIRAHVNATGLHRVAGAGFALSADHGRAFRR